MERCTFLACAVVENSLVTSLSYSYAAHYYYH